MRHATFKGRLLVALVFGGVLACSLTLVFADDDASTGAAATAKPAAPGALGNAPGSAPGSATESKFEDHPAEAHAADSPGAHAGCLADEATLEDMKRQKAEQESRQKALDAREAELKAREQALTDQLKELAAARDDFEKIQAARKAESDAKVLKLVEAVEAMNPKAASTLLAGLDEGLATATMAKLSTTKLAKVMNVMDPTRSTKLSELLAGVARARTHAASKDAPAATPARNPASAGKASGRSKGGEEE